MHDRGTSGTFARMGLLALSLLAFSGAGVDAQRWASEERAPGWIGISFERVSDRRGRTVSVVISDVRRGSPAEQAGIRPGDRLLAINELDRPSELAELNERLRLRAGEPVLIRIERDGEEHELNLRAAPRPSGFEPSTTFQLSVQTDDMVDTWVRLMDSLRIELVQEGREVWVRGSRSRPGASSITVVAGGSSADRRVNAPFEFFVFRGEQHDSLSREMVELNQSVAELKNALREREMIVLRGSAQRDREAELEMVRDREVVRLRSALDEAAARSSRLETAMAKAARESASVRYLQQVTGTSRSGSSAMPDAAKASGEYRPLTPYLLGRNRVAGAEVVDLRPELAEYFGVDGGVLVVDVAPRTPASIAGIVPGDVITRIDQVGVRSVEDLRFGVSMSDETLPISLVRQGSSVQVLLRRQ